MTEIVLSNFEEKLRTLEASLKDAIFVGIDTEFSGLRSNNENPSLFDSNSERYSNLKNHIENFIIIQYGLAVFHYDKENNSYSADVFNIYLFPRSFGTVDRNFKFQSSSVEFLCRYNYDFNKMTYEGLSYVRTQEEAQLRADLASGVLLEKLNAHCEADVRDIREEICSEVGKWVATAKEGETLLVHYPKQLRYFLLHHELRKTYPKIWSENVEDEALAIRVRKVSAETRAKLEIEKGNKEEAEKALLHVLGFSRVISLLSKLTVPIIGHNVLLDVMMTYQQFVEPLPETYKEFKLKFQNLFGSIYDTKFLGHEIKRKINSTALWQSSLPSVYTFLKSKQCDVLAPNPPVIKTEAYCTSQTKSNKNDDFVISSNHKDTTNIEKNHSINKCIKKEGEKFGNGFTIGESILRFSMGVHDVENAELEEHFHEAGWDAFCAGYVFLRLAHVDVRQRQLGYPVKNGVVNKRKEETKAVASDIETQSGDKETHGIAKLQNGNGEIKLPPLSWTDLQETMMPYENKVHISMGQISHMNLVGSDEISKRPPLLHIQTRKNKELNVPEIQDMFAKYATVDIRPYTRHRAMVAVTSNVCARDLLRGFKNHPALKVEIYNPIKHSRAVRAAFAISSVALISAGIALIVLGGKEG